MNRTVVAFLVAPLWVPLVVAPFAALVAFPYAAQFAWVVITTVISATFAYGSTFALGLPAFLVLRSLNLATPRIAAGVGFAIGSLAWMAFIACFALALGSGRETLEGWPPQLPAGLIFLLAPGLLGTLVGVTIWAIARPDRDLCKP